MGSREWTYWLVFLENYPWGDDWEQAALQSWAAVAPHTKRQMRVSDFLPPAMRASQAIQQAMTPAQIKAVLLGKGK